MSSVSLAVSAEESRRLSSFLADQARARARVASLEEQARVFHATGKPVPAAAHLRTARLLRWMWCIDQ